LNCTDCDKDGEFTELVPVEGNLWRCKSCDYPVMLDRYNKALRRAEKAEAEVERLREPVDCQKCINNEDTDQCRYCIHNDNYIDRYEE